MTITPAEKAYQDWVDEGTNRYGTVHRDAFIAGYEKGYVDGNQSAVEAKVSKFIDAHTKPWVGLTDDERKDILHEIDPLTVRLPLGFKRFAEGVETKLKEKNHAV